MDNNNIFPNKDKFINENEIENQENENENLDKFNEFKNKLLFFSNLKSKEKEYNKIKSNVLTNWENMKSEDIILNDLYNERNQLILEYKRYESILKDVQNDIFRIESIIVESKQQREQFKKQVSMQTDIELVPLKDEIDSMRIQIQLPQLPPIDSEKDKLTSNYLTNRLNEERIKQQQQQQNKLNQSSNNNNNNFIDNNSNNSGSGGIDYPNSGSKRGRKKRISLS
ncbi:hypothetical protein DDB_G0277197 [Dictyostelium discoideum AX4]|uniref:Uncharacterized protein n=1 Tax=Dictyostelium discoideum TaxID=44689 RepID=Q86K63_DICDI|nr:hypothetical protein DDB_G0277197 [Dictyostelium discoideum AX4]EAL68784.1 hypothetical protein DDB_G0277197 [Dictyostelium discoideum AX4]|eukprot:XP_642723.1 hypothetical protein DDB_G0277197 [Dictyostelium discoideum AX4]